MTQKKRYKPSGGFTLVEILAVLAVLGIALMVTGAMIGHSDGLQVRAAAEQVVAALTYAQTCAIAGPERVQVVFDPVNEAYELQDETGAVLADPVKKGAGVVPNPGDFTYHVDFPTSGHLRRVVIETADFDGSNTVWFDRLGAPHGGALADGPPPLTTGSVQLRAGAASLTVNVEPVTGQITVH